MTGAAAILQKLTIHNWHLNLSVLSERFVYNGPHCLLLVSVVSFISMERKMRPPLTQNFEDLMTSSHPSSRIYLKSSMSSSEALVSSRPNMNK